MRLSLGMRRWLPAALVAGTMMAGPVFAADGGRTYPGVTKPSDSRDLSFNGPGVVSKVAVKEGDAIQVGQSLIDQNDTVEQADMAKEIIAAMSNVQVAASEANLDYATKELARKQQEAKDHATSESELEQAQLDLVKAQQELNLAREEKQKAELEVNEDKAKIALKHIVSPINGVVLKINTHADELPSAEKPVMTVVQNNPLWVEADLQTADVKQLKLGQPLDFRYSGEDWVQGKIIFIAPEADARSDTQKVRLEVENPTNRASGMQVEVKVPDNLASASAK